MKARAHSATAARARITVQDRLLITSDWANATAEELNIRRASSGTDNKGRQPALSLPHLVRSGYVPFAHFVGGWYLLAFPEPFPNGLIAAWVTDSTTDYPAKMMVDHPHDWTGPTGLVIWAWTIGGDWFWDNFASFAYVAIGW